MEMELSRENRGKALTQHGESSKKSKIVALLAILGVRRQAKLDDEDYKVFASDLEEYELADIEAGLSQIGKRPRDEGETAFPSLGTMLAAIKLARRQRCDRESEEYRRRQDEEDAAKVRAERAAGVWKKTDEEIAKAAQKISI